MTPQHYSLVLSAVGGFFSLSPAAVAWAHHPMPRPDTGSGSPWFLMWFLGAGVFVAAFVATLAVFSILERRQRAGSKAQQSVRRS